MDETIRVVVADDHTLVREGTRHLLEQQGGIDVVAEAADGHEALTLVDRHRPDVVIVDIGMPGLNGIEVTRAVKAAHPDIAVLILTVHDDDQYVFALLDAGAAGYLLKDVGGGELVRAVQAVHAGEAVLHPAIAKKVLDRFRPSGEPRRPDELTERELGVLKLAAAGRSNKQIALDLGVSVRTVHAHLAHVFDKLGVASRTEAVIIGLRRGWLRLEELE